jgi:hypothetical protein
MPMSNTSRRGARSHAVRLTRGLLCCLVLATGFATVPAGAAYAGTWTLISCSQPNGQPAPTDGWTTSSTGSVGPDSGDVNTCAQGGTLTAVTSGEAPQNAYAGPEWVFQAPAGSTIAGGTLTATLTSPHGQTWLGTPSATYDSADVLANCQYNLACGQSGTLTGVFPITHTGGTNIYAVAVCVGSYEGATTCPATSGVDAAVSLSAADIELSNGSTPAASGIGGTLLSPGARGTQELAFTTSDPGGPGVYAVSAQVDGKTLYSGTPDNNGGECVPVGTNGGALMFDYNQPCRASESVDLPIDTTSVADGQHTLKVTVEDAAQNSSVVYDGAITTKNAPVDTSAPTIIAPSQVFVGAALSTHPGAWSAPTGAGSIAYGYQWEDCDAQGNNCQTIVGAQSVSYTPAPSDVGHTLRLVVNASDSDGLASAASAATSAVLSSQGSLGALPGPGTSGGASAGLTVIGSGTPNGAGASEGAVLHLGIHRTISSSFARRSLKLTGRLLDGQGRPIGGATLDVLQQVAGSGTLRVIRHAKTRANGSFIARVPAGPSRLIEVAYRAFSGDASYAAQAKINESVAAGVQLGISPRRTSSTGTITLSGRVFGPVPPQGTIVDLLVHYRGRWEPFRTPRTDSNGRFEVVYQFEGGVGHFPFRAEVPAGQAGFPFSEGYSKVVYVITG